MAKHSYESSLRTKSQKGKISAEIDAEIQGKIETKDIVVGGRCESRSQDRHRMRSFGGGRQ